MLDTARNNRDYLSDPTEGFSASGGDGRISLDDLDSFEAKMSAYTTLLALSGRHRHRGPGRP